MMNRTMSLVLILSALSGVSVASATDVGPEPVLKPELTLSKMPYQPCVEDRGGGRHIEIDPCPKPWVDPWVEPQPYPRPSCPRGYDYRHGTCVPKSVDPMPPYWEEKRPAIDGKIEGLQKNIDSAAESLGKGDVSSADGRFSALFDNLSSRGGAGGSSAVPAGSFGFAAAPASGLKASGLVRINDGRAVPIPALGGAGKARIILVECGDLKGDCKSKEGQKAEGIVKDLKDIYETPQRMRRENEENERKYREGTDQWNKTHEDYQQKHPNNKNVS